MRWLGIAVAATATAMAGVLSAHWNLALGQGRPSDLEPPNSSPTQSVVLVTIDGVRPREIFVGADPALAGRAGLPAWARGSAEEMLPNLNRLFFKEGAALGDPRLRPGIAASGPNYISLPGYLEIMTGAPTDCRTNDCTPKPVETIADATAERSSGSAAVFGSWEMIRRASSQTTGNVAVTAGRSGFDSMAPYPGNGLYRPDNATLERAMSALDTRRPPFVWIALGDTDEWGHRNDYIGYLNALRAADTAVGEIAARLAAEGESGARTLLLVTTDHGRDEGFASHGGPASAGVWLLARGPEVAPVGSIEARKQRYLRDIAPTMRSLLGLPARTCEGCGEVIDEILLRKEEPGGLSLR